MINVFDLLKLLFHQTVASIELTAFDTRLLVITDLTSWYTFYLIIKLRKTSELLKFLVKIVFFVDLKWNDSKGYSNIRLKNVINRHCLVDSMKQIKTFSLESNQNNTRTTQEYKIKTRAMKKRNQFEWNSIMLWICCNAQVSNEFC